MRHRDAARRRGLHPARCTFLPSCSTAARWCLPELQQLAACGAATVRLGSDPSRYRPADGGRRGTRIRALPGETVGGSSSRDLDRAGLGRAVRDRPAGRRGRDRPRGRVRRAALGGDSGKTSANERSRLLHALADAVVANRKELAELESRNVGKAISSTKAELSAPRSTSASTPRRSRRSPAARIRSAARSSPTR